MPNPTPNLTFVLFRILREESLDVVLKRTKYTMWIKYHTKAAQRLFEDQLNMPTWSSFFYSLKHLFPSLAGTDIALN